ncbi:unnamed protein product [Caenorhabditis auriculariae]|uniref:MI domain-containing protein n=1 Tax=Caenorhabditis auriculariae TaxID=2777116 RepID=A0A8S1GMM3_9PELO|nr:unnamed protein product [Caenorhabditis auriculariae]
MMGPPRKMPSRLSASRILSSDKAERGSSAPPIIAMTRNPPSFIGRSDVVKQDSWRTEFDQLRLNNTRDDFSDSDEEDSEDGFGEEEKTASKRPRNFEVTINRRKRKYGLDESESDSDQDLTYEQFLKEVEEKKKELLDDPSKSDDLAIKRYGKLLGYKEEEKNRDGKPKIAQKLRNDGLDFLLEFCNADDRKDFLENHDVEDEAEASDDEVTGSEKSEENEVDLHEDEESEEEFVEDEEEEDGESTAFELSDEEDEEEEVNAQPEVSGQVNELSEDIYGRTINKKTSELIKFDPMAARKKLGELEEKSEISVEQRMKVERSVTGLINRLSEATVIKSKQSIAEMWITHSKNDVKCSLHKILCRVISSPFALQPSLMSTYAMFLALLHYSVSSEISAYFVENLLCDLIKSIKEGGEAYSLSDGDKSIENRVILVSMLVNFKVLKPEMILDVIDKFRTELNLETIRFTVLIISNAYKIMKKAAWPQVNERINFLCEEFEKTPISNLTRAKFLIDELSSLKKNPPKSIDFSVVEHHLRIMQGLNKNKSQGSERELGMSLDDLLVAEERGRWWIVGSAFRLPENHAALGTSSQKNIGSFSEKMVSLAVKAGMNSDVRRNIFCSVAYAEDTDDAFEKLLRLCLKGEKEREIIHVLIIMMLREKSYNPFYATLLFRFCEFNKRFVITTQYALWDRIRECAGLQPRERSHLALLLHSLVSREVLPITVLKVVEWGSLDGATSSLLRRFFSLLATTSEAVLRRIFEPLIKESTREKFEMLSEGLRVFLHMHFKGDPTYENVDRWIIENNLV